MFSKFFFSLQSFLLILSHVILVYGSFHKVVTYHHTLHADDITHTIVKRGLYESDNPYNEIKEVKFSTLGREFRLILTPKRGILHSEFTASTVDKNGEETPIAVDRENFYEGRLFGETDSSANVHIDDGVMTANIHHGGETYHIEPSWRHIPNSDNRTMVAYRGSDIRFSWDHDDYKKKGFKPCEFVEEGLDLKTNGNVSTIPERRVKRQIDGTSSFEQSPNKTRCTLSLVADYRFFLEMGGSDAITTINYLISSIDRVHKIYNGTTWRDKSDADGFDGMGFVIKKILVHNEPTKVRNGEVHYNMVRDKWDVRTLLEVFSRENTHKDYCLAHLFTDLKFEGGILGLAYVASPLLGSVGGICTPEYLKNGVSLYLNTGVTSSRNHYKQRVITREADLVTAHEFGHNWGSKHDPDSSDCSPSASQGGSYLMYTFSVAGYDVNNKQFSPCSMRSIRQVLQAKSSLCFSEPQESFCGNLRVEKNEQCDAGRLGSEDNDPCCSRTCQLRPNATCSDRNSPCCQNCQFMSRGMKCRDAQHLTCEEESKCLGNTSECPTSPPMPDGTVCVEHGQCRAGRCIPYCETLGRQSCMCDKIKNSCKRCCRTTMNDSCDPIEPLDILPSGTPCIQGVCNDEGICEKTVQDFVERFWDIIEETNINKFLTFLRDNVVGTVIVVTATIWIPVSILINYFDKKRLNKTRKLNEWRKRRNLMYILATKGSNGDTYPRRLSQVRGLSKKYNPAASFRMLR